MLVQPEPGRDEWGPYWVLRIASGYRQGEPMDPPWRHRDWASLERWCEEIGYSLLPVGC